MKRRSRFDGGRASDRRRAMWMGWVGVGLVLAACPLRAETVAPPESPSLPAMHCTAEQTGGFHDYPDDGERYEPALFHPQSFRLETNLVFMMNLAGDESSADLYLTLTRELPTEEGGVVEEATELECRRVRGGNDDYGFSCVNLPPSEMMLLNARSLRFTRTAVGGWTFAGATDAHEGDSIFVEYGQCEPLDPT